MKAITIHQPWASLIAMGLKRFETRGWRTCYRGPLAIHASKNTDWLDLDKHGPGFDFLMRQYGFISYRDNAMFPIGCVVGHGSLAGCVRSGAFDSLVLYNPSRERAFGDWSAGRFGFEIAGVRRLKTPIPWAGQQQLWTVPPKLESLIHEAEYITS